MWKQLELPPLFAEVFEIPGSDEDLDEDAQKEVFKTYYFYSC